MRRILSSIEFVPELDSVDEDGNPSIWIHDTGKGYIWICQDSDTKGFSVDTNIGYNHTVKRGLASLAFARRWVAMNYHWILSEDEN